MRLRLGVAALVIVTLALAACGEPESELQPPLTTSGPDGGVPAPSQYEAAMLEIQKPLQPLGIYLADVQVLKNDVSQQIEVHQYCAQLDGEMFQCAMFDAPTVNARLIGVRYFISSEMFDSLPPEAQSQWHPLNYEILSGLLVAPEMAPLAERTLMTRLLNNYAKSWFLWEADTVAVEGKLPRQPARLGWSFNRAGEVQPAVVRSLSATTGVDLALTARERLDLRARAQPQEGVDALKGRFGADTLRPPDAKDTNQ